MRWKGRRESQNVEDRRSVSGPAIAGGGLLGFILLMVVMFLGGDPRPMMQEMERTQLRSLDRRRPRPRMRNEPSSFRSCLLIQRKSGAMFSES